KWHDSSVDQQLIERGSERALLVDLPSAEATVQLPDRLDAVDSNRSIVVGPASLRKHVENVVHAFAVRRSVPVALTFCSWQRLVKWLVVRPWLWRDDAEQLDRPLLADESSALQALVFLEAWRMLAPRVD